MRAPPSPISARIPRRAARCWHWRNCSTTLSRKDFGLEWNVALEAGGLLVSDKIKITLDVSAIKQA